jgi:polyphenol oxidase
LFWRDGHNTFRDAALDRLPWLQHQFGTRLSSESVVPNNLAVAKQIHSDRVLSVDSPGVQGEGDALISNRPGVNVAIRTADCLPVLVADPRNRAVAAIHAGWRGVVSEIVPKTIEGMRRQFASRPEELVIAIGPGIGVCCFEVGPEVACQFESFFPDLDLSGRPKIDLIETIFRQMRRNGVNMEQISSAKLCSCCNPELFDSYRRDRGASGRMVTAIGVLEARRNALD